MRENDDSQVAGHGTLADGLGETAEPGEYSSTSEPYGDGGLDDSYGDDTYGTADAGDGDDEDAYDDSCGDDAYGDEGPPG